MLMLTGILQPLPSMSETARLQAVSGEGIKLQLLPLISMIMLLTAILEPAAALLFPAAAQAEV
jgi:hypothetical protein